MNTLLAPDCGNPYCSCDPPCTCPPPCTCGLELIGEETVARWDPDKNVLVHSVVTTYGPISAGGEPLITQVPQEVTADD